MNRCVPRALLATVFTVALAFGLAACEKRGPEEVAELRDRMRGFVESAPRPAGARLDHAGARFDKGCVSLLECGSGGTAYASYAVRVRLPEPAPTDAAGLCRHLLDELAQHDLRMVSLWEGERVSYFRAVGKDDLPGSRSREFQPSWRSVDERACDTGKVVSTGVLRPDGSSPVAPAHLFLSFVGDEGEPALRYAVGWRFRGEDDSATRYGDFPSLTKSQLAHLRGRLEGEFIVAASPATDGVQGAPNRIDTRWEVPPKTKRLHFRVRCDTGEEVKLSVYDRDAAPPSKTMKERTVVCAGSTVDVRLPAFRSTSLSIEHYGYEREVVNKSLVQRPGRGSYTVTYAPKR